MEIRFNRFPEGKKRAVTFSFDDGRVEDRTLTALMRKHGMKGTYHLNSGKFGQENYINADEVAVLYEGHEVAGHTVTHPFLNQMPRVMQMQELEQDRRTLESLLGNAYPVVGLSWPFGAYNEQVIDMAAQCGYAYSRTVRDTFQFGVPDRFLTWDPTAHHSRITEKMWDAFIDDHRNDMKLFYVWGHSYEFQTQEDWNKIEQFFIKCENEKEQIWFATNIEIMDYLIAMRNLRFSADMKGLSQNSPHKKNKKYKGRHYESVGLRRIINL